MNHGDLARRSRNQNNHYGATAQPLAATKHERSHHGGTEDTESLLK